MVCWLLHVFFTYLVEQQPDQAVACCESLFTGLALYFLLIFSLVASLCTPTDDTIYVYPGRSALAPPATLIVMKRARVRLRNEKEREFGCEGSSSRARDCEVRSANLHARVATTLGWLSSLSAVLSGALCMRGVRLKKRDKSAMQPATLDTKPQKTANYALTHFWRASKLCRTGAELSDSVCQVTSAVSARSETDMRDCHLQVSRR